MFPFCHFFWTAFNIGNTERLNYSNPDSNDVSPSEKTTQLARKSSEGPLTQRRPQEPTSSSSNADAAHGTPSFQRATPGELDHPASPPITHERNPSSNDLPSQPPGVNDKPGHIAEEDNSEGSTGHHVKLAAPGVSPEKEIARLEDERLVEVERKLSAMLAVQTERDRRVAQLTEELVQKVALLEQAEANAQRDLAEVRGELEARKSELAAVHLRLKDAESGWAKSKAEADTSGAKTTANLVNTDEDGVLRRLTERVRAIEAEIASRRWNEKSFEMMECRNEG